MPDLDFAIERAETLPHAATPQLLFKLRINQVTRSGEPQVTIHSVALRCQIRIEPTQRSYNAITRDRLRELFGPDQLWGRSLHSLLWTHVNLATPAFQNAIVVDLPAPCSFDFNVIATKYFDALSEGDAPLCFLFSGSIFYADSDGALQVCQIPWEKEAAFRLPVSIWNQTIKLYYPNTAWLALDKDVFDRLYAYKRTCGFPTWERALEGLLDSALENVSP